MGPRHAGAALAFEHQFARGVAANPHRRPGMFERRAMIARGNLQADFHLRHSKEKPLFAEPELAGGAHDDFLTDAEPQPIQRVVIADVPVPSRTSVQPAVFGADYRRLPADPPSNRTSPNPSFA